jgi:hypothetical protein
MRIIIENVNLLKKRIKTFIRASEYLLKNRKEMYWSRWEMKRGKIQNVSLTKSKRRYKELWINRYNEVFYCLESNDFSKIDWIEVRDVLYWCGFQIEMKNEKSYKALRESRKDIVIAVAKSPEQFEENVRIHSQFI